MRTEDGERRRGRVDRRSGRGQTRAAGVARQAAAAAAVEPQPRRAAQPRLDRARRPIEQQPDLLARCGQPGRRADAVERAPLGGQVARRAAARRRSVAAASRSRGATQRAGHLEPVRHDDLRGGGRRRGADVGREVGERHVDLVPDAAHDRQRVRDDRPDDPLVVERPQVLERAAAAGEDRQRRGIVAAARPRCRRRHSAPRRRSAVTMLAGAPSPCTWAATSTTCDERPAAREDVADVAPDGAGSGW